MLVAAFFAGVLNFKKPEDKQEQKQTPSLSKQKTEPVETVSVDEQISQDDLNLDDISLDDEFEEIKDTVEEEKVEPQEDMIVEPEEDVIDIDDSSASGRLSALRREMASDSGSKDKSKDELSKRLDSFLKDR